MGTGNTKLVDYGIQNEKSDIRAHVCPLVGCVYAFKTKDGRACVESGKYPASSAFTGDTETARGYLVPPRNIPGCHQIKIPAALLAVVNLQEHEDTIEKGNKAVLIISELLKKGLFPIDLIPKDVADKDLQVEGVDIIIALEARIQVKCDYRGGPKAYGGTGNLFLQVSECNPHKKY